MARNAAFAWRLPCGVAAFLVTQSGCGYVVGAEQKRLLGSADSGASAGEGGGGGAGGANGGAGSGGIAAASASGAGGAPAHGARPPPRPTEVSGPQPAFAALAVAMRRLYWGMNDRDTGERDADAWKKIGFDLDGVVSTTDLLESGGGLSCQPDVEPAAIVDGDDGRDNIVGATFFQTLATLDPGAERALNDGLEAGEATLLLVLEDIQSDVQDPRVPANLLVVASERDGPGPPKWDGLDQRRISSVSYFPGSFLALTRFPDGYIADRVWVSGDQDAASLNLAFPMTPAQNNKILARLPGRSGWITFDLTDGAGTFGFASTRGEFIDAWKETGNLAFGCKGGSAVDGVLQDAAKNLDTRHFATWVSAPDEPCNALSWAFDVEWTPVAMPDLKLAVEEEFKSTCADAGR